MLEHNSFVSPSGLRKKFDAAVAASGAPNSSFIFRHLMELFADGKITINATFNAKKSGKTSGSLSKRNNKFSKSA